MLKSARVCDSGDAARGAPFFCGRATPEGEPERNAQTVALPLRVLNEIIHVSQLFSIGSFYLPTYGPAGRDRVSVRGCRWRSGRPALRPESRDGGEPGDLCALVGLLGAKLLMFVMDFSYYARNPERIFSLETLLSAGVYYGGFLLALAFCWWYLKRQNMPFLATADVLSRACAGARNRQARLLRGGLLLGYALRFALGRGLHESEAHDFTGVPLNVALHRLSSTIRCDLCRRRGISLRRKQAAPAR